MREISQSYLVFLKKKIHALMIKVASRKFSDPNEMVSIRAKKKEREASLTNLVRVEWERKKDGNMKFQLKIIFSLIDDYLKAAIFIINFYSLHSLATSSSHQLIHRLCLFIYKLLLFFYY
jgi:hypothetical protein